MIKPRFLHKKTITLEISIVSKMSLKRVVHLLNLFDSFAFNSESSQLSQHRKLIFVIRTIHIVCAITSTFAQFKYILMLYPLGIMTVVNEFLLCSTSLTTYSLIIIDSLSNHRSQKIFWCILRHIDDHFCSQSGLSFRNYLILFGEFFTATLSIVLINIIELGENGIYFAYYVVVCHVRIFYYIFYLNVMDFQMRNIEMELKNLQKCNAVECHRLKWIRKYVSLVHEMACQLNKAFGWSNAASILYCFHELLAAVNWVSISFSWVSIRDSIGKLAFKYKYKY